MKTDELLDLLGDLSRRTLSEELEGKSGLSQIVAALAEFAASLYPEGHFVKKRERWVFEPQNFVTFQILKTRPEVIITLRGNPKEFFVYPELPLSKYRHESYSSCSLTSSSQLLAAASYIHRAYQLFRKGRNRVRTTIDLIEKEL